jgi:hypothetical protein
MEVRIAGEELDSLYRWLREDRAVARGATVSVSTTPGTGHMGMPDLLTVVLSNATALPALVTALATWRRARGRVQEVTFTVGEISMTVRGDTSEETVRQWFTSVDVDA